MNESESNLKETLYLESHLINNTLEKRENLNAKTFKCMAKYFLKVSFNAEIIYDNYCHRYE